MNTHSRMVYAEFYEGQGLGNQLWTYAVVRAFAKKNNCDFSLLSANRFKGKFFSFLDFGGFSENTLGEKPNTKTLYAGDYVYFEPKRFHRIEGFDMTLPKFPTLNSTGNTKLEGNFESEIYLEIIKSELIDCFRCTPEVSKLSKEICVINLRGGEFSKHKALGLSRTYFEFAIRSMIDLLGFVPEFKVVTDDVTLAKEYFPDFDILSEEGIFNSFSAYPERKVRNDLTWLQNARYLILSNSSFSWWGAWTNTVAEVVLAPKYWARHNSKSNCWSPGGILTDSWFYIDREGNLFSSNQCKNEMKSEVKRMKNFVISKATNNWWIQ